MAATGEHFPSASLYVGDLAPEVNEALLFEIFNAVGPVASIRVCRDAVTRRSLGYAYVNFHNAVDAERALDSMNFTQIAARPCRIMWSQRDPSLRKSGVGNIFVKNLDKSIDHKTLYDTFSVFGNILSCKVSTSMEGESLGYGFVHYETDEYAMKAIENANGMVIAGLKVYVAPFKSKIERDSSDAASFTNVYVKNLPEEFTEENFIALFKEFGPITSLMLSHTPEGKFKGFGFINFEDPMDASAACEKLNDTEFEGKTLYVGRAMKRSERSKMLRERFEAIKLEKQKKWAGCNLYVKNLSDVIDEQKLKEEFEKFGTITSVRIMFDQSNRSRGFGFVCFSTPEEASQAVKEMNGAILDRKPLYVGYAQRKDVRRAQLEAQYAHRQKITAQIPPMFPQNGPMYYPGVPSRQGYMYPPQTMVSSRNWNPQAGPAVVSRPRVGMYAMPATRGRGASRGARGGSTRSTVPAQSAIPPQAAIPAMPQVPQLTLQALAAASAEEQKQMIGERLFPQIRELESRRAGKITGMLLEMDNSDLLDLLEDSEALKGKVEEAVRVLEAHELEVEKLATA